MRKLAGVLVMAVMLVGMARAQDGRPRITGISHVGYFVSDLPKAERFWHDFLGYDVEDTLPKKDGAGVATAFVKINDHQQVELFNEPPVEPRNMLHDLCFMVDDVAAMEAYLRGRGVAVVEGRTEPRAGDYTLKVKDPDGTLVEFVQSVPTGREMQAKGKFLPATRIADRIYHVGFTVSDSRKTMAFYALLGFTETWRGTGNPKELAWINLKVPDGTDYVELMLFHAPLDPNSLGGRNHTSLAVPDMAAAVKTLTLRAPAAGYDKPLVVRTGVNGKRQVNLFDPDGTRVELMEPFTADGKVVPSSTAPAPVPLPE